MLTGRPAEPSEPATGELEVLSRLAVYPHVYPVEPDPDGGWRVCGGLGGAGETPRRSTPWVNLGLGIHTIVVPGTPRDGLYLLDGLLDPQSSVRPQQIMTDTAGYTDIMFGCYRILDFQLSPRMADSGGARFWKLDPFADYGRLNAVATNLIDRGVIEHCYDDILRVGGSLLQRQTTGSELMRALRSHTRHLATLGRALAAVGRVPKTIHLLDYCNDPIYRRAILGQINRGEGRHELARRVCHGNKGELPQPYQRGQEEQIGALGLVVNCIVLYNTI
jgi:TnpA family transposase